MSSLIGIGGRLYRGEKSIDFIGKRRRWYAISGILIIASLFALSVQGLKLGIEFKGGSSFRVTDSSVTVEAARAAVTSTGLVSEKVHQVLHRLGCRLLFSVSNFFLPIYSNFSIPAVFLSIPVIATVICSQ